MYWRLCMPVDHAICIVAYNSVSKQLLASNTPFKINIGKLQKIRSYQKCALISYYRIPIGGLHNLAMVNGYDIMRSTFATLWILSERLNLKRSMYSCLNRRGRGQHNPHLLLPPPPPMRTGKRKYVKTNYPPLSWTLCPHLHLHVPCMVPSWWNISGNSLHSTTVCVGENRPKGVWSLGWQWMWFW